MAGATFDMIIYWLFFVSGHRLEAEMVTFVQSTLDSYGIIMINFLVWYAVLELRYTWSGNETGFNDFNIELLFKKLICFLFINLNIKYKRYYTIGVQYKK